MGTVVNVAVIRGLDTRSAMSERETKASIVECDPATRQKDD